MIEIEIKVKIPDRISLEANLLQIGFVRESCIWETDQYFNRKSQDFRETDEALRIRVSEEEETGKIQATLNYKGPKLDQISMTRMERETTVGDPLVAQNILEQLGFYPVLPVKKRRTYFRKEQMHACVDQVEGLGEYLELEILAQQECEREAALTRMSETLQHLGLNPEHTIRHSYLSMLENMSA